MTTKQLVKSAFVFAVMLASSVSYAQQRPQLSPEERANRQLRWMQKNLALTDDQMPKVRAILVNAAIQADRVKSEPGGPGKKADRMDEKQAKELNMQSVLTGEQYQKYVAHEQQMKERQQQRKEMQQQQQPMN